MAGPGAGRRAALALVTAEADRLEESRLSALELRIEADLGCGRHAQLVPELRRLLSDHPLREGLWALLIRALDGAGRHAEALAAYGQAREVIADELGVDPGPELQRLYQAMLTADAARRSRPRGSAARGASAGRPGRRRADHRADAPPAGSRVVVPARSRPAARRRGRLHRPGRPLERLYGLVSGPGSTPTGRWPSRWWRARPGLGKTALAIHAAHGCGRISRTGSSTSACAAGASIPCRRTRCWPGSSGTSGWTGPGCRWTPKSAPPCTAPGWPSGRC